MTMDPVPFLFAADLDGTLLPNTGVRARSGCVERTQTLLRELLEAGCPRCFVSGRHLAFARRGPRDFGLPEPNWWICNAGTEVYNAVGQPDEEWQNGFGPPFDHSALQRSLRRIVGLTMQESDKQGSHKFSLYYPEPATLGLQQEILLRVNGVHERLRLVASVEQSTGRALLDILPASAGKALAVWHIAGRYGLPPERIFFAGDSGDDLDAVISGACGTLVGNTPEDVLMQAGELWAQCSGAKVFFAAACYGDGVIEGLSHFGLWPARYTGARPSTEVRRRATTAGIW